MLSRGWPAPKQRGPGRKTGRRAAMLLVAGLLAGGHPARAADCGLELVLAMDVSYSVVNSEYDLQMGGLADAFRDPEVAEAITWITGGVMATVTQWSGPEAQAQPVPWTHLTNAASVAAKPPLSDVVLDDGIAALEAMLVPEPLKDPFARVPLFARRRTILLKNAIDDAGEGAQLGASDRAAAPITRRRRKPQHLGNRLAVKPEYTRRRANGHPLDVARAPYPTIQFH